MEGEIVDQFQNDKISDYLDFNSKFISSFKATEEKFTKKQSLIRYHYTSAGALKSILSGSPKLRFTDVRYMNDHSEMVYCVKCILEYLSENKYKYPFCQEVVNELLLKKHSAQEYIDLSVSRVEFEDIVVVPFAPSREFIFCMSESNNSLQMWNYYVHNGKYEGYNIGFDIYKFLKSFDSEKTNVVDPIIFKYGKVLYKKSNQDKEIANVVDFVEQGNQKKDDNALAVKAGYLKYYIETYGLFFKHEVFNNEKEYRIVLSIAEHNLHSKRDYYINDNLKNMKLNFYERNGVFVPYMEVPINKDAIKEIYISPTIEKDIAKQSLEEFLYINGYDAGVKVSDIPIRF